MTTAIDTPLVRILEDACQTNSGFVVAASLIMEEMGVKTSGFAGMSDQGVRNWLEGKGQCRPHMRVPTLYCTMKRQTGETWKIPTRKRLFPLIRREGAARRLRKAGFSGHKIRLLLKGEASPAECMAVEMLVRDGTSKDTVDRLATYVRLSYKGEDKDWWSSKVRRMRWEMGMMEMEDATGEDAPTIDGWCQGVVPPAGERAHLLLASYLWLRGEQPLRSLDVRGDMAQALSLTTPHTLARRMGVPHARVMGVAYGHIKMKGLEAAAFTLRARAAALRWIDMGNPFWQYHPDNRFAGAWRVEKMLKENVLQAGGPALQGEDGQTSREGAGARVPAERGAGGHSEGTPAGGEQGVEGGGDTPLRPA